MNVSLVYIASCNETCCAWYNHGNKLVGEFERKGSILVICILLYYDILFIFIFIFIFILFIWRGTLVLKGKGPQPSPWAG